ncbi:MAG: hypothetical protein AB7G62_06645 [Magnetospirillum sp.]
MILRRKTKDSQAEAARRDLWSEMVVRHRSPGHIRFDLPARLCSPHAVAALETGLRRVPGIYRVTVFPAMGKLSIRWFEEECSLAELVRALAALVGPAAEAGAVPAAPAPGLLQRLKQAGPLARLRTRYDDVRAKGELVYRLMAAKSGVKGALPFDAKDWFVHFANDLVVFYLIRLHWDRIVGQWLPRPWTFRYQWMTVVYLVFLLVRFRKAKK